jgi:hypothetical protein
MAKDYQGIEKLKPCRHHHEHIDGGGVLHVIVQKRAPGRGRDFAPPWQISADRGPAHFDAELEQLAMDRGAPQRGFARLIFRISSRISRLIFGRPRWRDRRRQ